jgi:hypothetical protein
MSVDPERASTATEQLHAKRWLILILLGFAQLMVTLDVTIVNIARFHRPRRHFTSRPRTGSGR